MKVENQSELNIGFKEVLKDDGEYWSLYDDGKFLEPLRFSNGKTQDLIVREVVNLIKRGNKVIFVKGVCGTGKSAIALNIARVLGRASIVVPIKNLQNQYAEDYMKRKYLIKNGKRMKIAMITGRDNHDSLIFEGKSCADKSLPDTIPITEKNAKLIEKYYMENPLINSKNFDMGRIKRISIAPANPYWSPILPGNFELQIKDADKKRYLGLGGKDFIFYHRERGCGYFDQYQAYIDADAIIFNSAKYKIESALDRKPYTDVEIIDEADEFLDNFSNQEEINLSRLMRSLALINKDDIKIAEVTGRLSELIEIEEKNKKALGINEDEIIALEGTRIEKILNLFIKNPDIWFEISMDEGNYSGKVFEIAREFKNLFRESYISFRRFEDDLIVSLISVDLSNKFRELIEKNKAIVLMSGTIHSKEVLEHIYGIKDYEVVEAETINQGSIEIIRTGMEFDCRFSNFRSKKHSREEYLNALNDSVRKSPVPVLIHVNSFEDLPLREEVEKYGTDFLMSREKLIELQSIYKKGELIKMFKDKKIQILFTTKCSRGVDFPGDICNSIVFTKYPNPNVRDIFWRILRDKHKDYYWEFYKDRAWRDFLQKVYRALRSKNDRVNVLSPDLRVLNAVRELQEEFISLKTLNSEKIDRNY